MFTFASFALFALAISSVTALVVPRGPDAPADWSSSLEVRFSVFGRPCDSFRPRTMRDIMPAIWLSAATQSTMTLLSLTAAAILFRCDTCLSTYRLISNSPQNGAQPNPSCPSPSAVDDSLDNDDDCEDDSSSAPTPTASPTTATSPTPAPLNNSAAKEQDTDVDLAVDAHIVQGGMYVTDLLRHIVSRLTHPLMNSATFYYQQGNAGACGHYNSDDALIAAMGQFAFPRTLLISDYCVNRLQNLREY